MVEKRKRPASSSTSHSSSRPNSASKKKPKLTVEIPSESDILKKYDRETICSHFFNSPTRKDDHQYSRHYSKCSICDRDHRSSLSAQISHLKSHHSSVWPQKFMESRTKSSQKPDSSPSLWNSFLSFFSPTTGPTQKQHDAAITLQNWYRSFFLPRRYSKEIDRLSATFHSEFPRGGWNKRLQVLASNLEVDKKNKKLVLGAKGNRPLLEVEDRLEKLIIKVDSVESGGFASVREQRKELIKEIQGFLADIESVKLEKIERSVKSK